MTVSKIRTDYEQLRTMAQFFSQQADDAQNGKVMNLEGKPEFEKHRDEYFKADEKMRTYLARQIEEMAARKASFDSHKESRQKALDSKPATEARVHLQIGLEEMINKSIISLLTRPPYACLFEPAKGHRQAFCLPASPTPGKKAPGQVK